MSRLKNNLQQRYTLEQATMQFWRVQRQWNGQYETKDFTAVLTTYEAQNILRTIVTDVKLPIKLKKAATDLQQAIIHNTTIRKQRSK